MATVKRLCVYCGSSGKVAEAYRAAAIRLGGLLGEHKIGLVYGGGRIGLMGLLADAALEAGGEVTGIIPDHLHDREICLLYTSPSPRDRQKSRMPSSA